MASPSVLIFCGDRSMGDMRGETNLLFIKLVHGVSVEVDKVIHKQDNEEEEDQRYIDRHNSGVIPQIHNQICTDKEKSLQIYEKLLTH